MQLLFVLKETFYRSNSEVQDKLMEGLREQGYRVEVEVVADQETVSFSSLFEEKGQAAGPCVIFTHQEELRLALSNSTPAGIPHVLIAESEWLSSEHPQLVHEFINHASAYIKGSK
jgi:hypothetical protein